MNISLKDMPVVIQFNKRDLPNVRPDSEIEQLARRGREPVFRASAVNGEGVLETFFGLLHLVWTKLEAEHQLSRTLGMESHEFIPVALRKLGLKQTEASLLRACVGGSLDYKKEIP